MPFGGQLPCHKDKNFSISGEMQVYCGFHDRLRLKERRSLHFLLRLAGPYFRNSWQGQIKILEFFVVASRDDCSCPRSYKFFFKFFPANFQIVMPY